jgi:hypothetical protein
VIIFESFYGDMLASWFRMKFPHIIHDAHAMSAPIMFFSGSVSPYALNELVCRNWKKYNEYVQILTLMLQFVFSVQKRSNSVYKNPILVQNLSVYHNASSNENDMLKMPLVLLVEFKI